MDNKGYVLAKKDTQNAIDLLRTAMNSTEKENQSLEAHKSIKSRFTFEKRAARLKTLLNTL